VQADERVGLEPVSADAVTTIDQRHAYVCVVDQSVSEGHPHGAGSHHEVVGIDSAGHELTMTSPPRQVHT